MSKEAQKAYLDYIKDLFEQARLEGVTSRGMFGGYGIYKQGVMFGLIADSELYFRTDIDTQGLFIKAGGKQFTYTNNTRTAHLPYHTLPLEIIEDDEALPDWVEISLDTAIKHKKPKKKKTAKT